MFPYIGGGRFPETILNILIALYKCISSLNDPVKWWLSMKITLPRICPTQHCSFRISDRMFVTRTKEMILWSMILAFSSIGRSYCTRFAFCLLLPFAAAGNDSVCFLFRSWETARWQSLSAPQTLKSSVKGERFIPAVWRAWVVSLGFSLSNLWFLHLLWKWIKEVLAWTY